VNHLNQSNQALATIPNWSFVCSGLENQSTIVDCRHAKFNCGDLLFAQLFATSKCGTAKGQTCRHDSRMSCGGKPPVMTISAMFLSPTVFLITVRTRDLNAGNSETKAVLLKLEHIFNGIVQNLRSLLNPSFVCSL